MTATQAHAYVATNDDVPLGPDVPLFTGVPAPQPEPLRLDLVPQQFPKETATLQNQNERWLYVLEHAREKKAPSTLANYRSSVKRIFEIMPELRETRLADVDSETLRLFVNAASSSFLSPTSIKQFLVILKLVKASAKDHRGNKLFDLRDFNSEHIDAPPVGEQYRPCLTAGDIESLIAAAESDQERLLYAVLAASGLRVAELQAVRVGPQEEKHSTWDEEAASIYVRSSCFRDREIPRLKTKAAKRTVHIHSSVNELIAQFAEKHRKVGDYLFQDASGKGRPICGATFRRTMDKRLMGAAPHGARRFRVTFLRQQRVQEDILKLEIGHSSAGNDITSLYSRPSDEICTAAIEATGIGFNVGGKNA